MKSRMRLLSTSAALALALTVGQVPLVAGAASCDGMGGQLLSNGGFERSTAGWVPSVAGSNFVVIPSGGHDGTSYLRTSIGTAGVGSSMRQDVSYSSNPGDSFVATVWVRSDSGPGNGRLALWGTGGGGSESAATGFMATSDWQQVQVLMDTTMAHTALRLELYMDSNVQYAFDGATLTPLAATTSPAPAATAVLYMNEVMNPGSELISPNGMMHLIMQTDGNLVLYAPGQSARWNSHTDGHPGAWAQFNPDGNFVIYGPSVVPLWSTFGNEGGLTGGKFLQVQNDGNVVQYTAELGVAWTTNTQYFPAATAAQHSFPVGDGLQSPDGRYTLKVEQTSVALYGPDGKWLWKTPSNGYSITQFVVQADGNLVVYTTNGVAWNSETGGTGGQLFQVQNDGNVVFYTTAMVATWNSFAAATLVRPSQPDPPTSPSAPPVSPWNCSWGNSCLAYSGFNPGTTWWGQYMCDNPTGFNCTNYVAYRLASRGVQDFTRACGKPRVANATGWDNNAAACGLRVDTTPAAGAVIVWEGGSPEPSGPYHYSNAGHVAYIDAMSSSTLYVSQASCTQKAGSRITLTWPIVGVSTGEVHVIHP